MKDWVPAHLHTLRAYEPGKPIEELERELGIQGALKLASNENPLGPSPKAVAAAKKALEQANLYPDGAGHALRAALSKHVDVDPAAICLGAGSNELIHLLVRTFCTPGKDRVIAHEYAFISYRMAAAAHNCAFYAAPVGKDLRCDVEALLGAIDDNTRVVFLANPNNPTGAHLTVDEMNAVLARIPERALLVVDEAYFEYASLNGVDYETVLPRVSEHKNLVVLRTFAKAYGLAALRVGYGVMDPEVAGYLHRVRRPFHVNAVAQVAACAALDDVEHVKTSAAVAKDGLARLAACAEGAGARAFPTLTNFVLIDTGREAADVYDALLHKGVIVRPMAAWGLPHHIRVSVGTPEQMDVAEAALKEVLG